MKKIALFGLFLILMSVFPSVSLAYGTLSLSQTNLYLSAGQSSIVSAYTANGQVVNLTSVSNSYVAYANISGNQITIYGLGNGSTDMTFCTFDNSCASVFVTVSGYNNYGNNNQISFSQNNVTLNTGQTMSISVYNSTGSVYISSNSNSNVASAYASGNIINLTGINSGSTTITVCGSNASCNSLYVTVSGSGQYGQISCSRNSVSLNTGDYSNITVYNTYNNSLYLSSNSNSAVVSASLSGNLISLHALMPGFSSLSVCGNNSNCASLSVSVTGSQYSNLTFSQPNVSLNQNQTQTVSVYNSTGSAYISNNSNSNAVSAYVSGSSINLTGLNPGYATLTVCSTTSACGYLYVTVASGGINYGQITFSQSSVNLNLNQSQSVTIYSNNSYNYSYYVSSNSNSSVASASISGNVLNLYGLNYGTTNIAVCQSSAQCGTVYVTVGYGNNYPGNLYFTSTTLPQPVSNQYYSAQLNVTGGTAPYSFVLNSGSLPQGLILNGTGQIYGTATGTYPSNFTVRATDNYGRTVISQNFTLTPSYTGNVLGAYAYNNGTLINDNGTVYLTYKNTKSPFTNAYAFTGLGYSFGSVISGSALNLNYSGLSISSANMAHPWGSWIKNGATIYFVQEQGLIPVPSMDIFINNGGNLNNVVTANNYDLAKPVQYVMTLNDWRLR